MKTVLAILSHVVHGYVGNRAMLFPLQYSGWDVDAINTTDFSNHPGYGSFKGKSEDLSSIDSLLDGLTQLDIDYDLVISGYIPNPSILSLLLEKSFKNWILDPVMGDNGKLYVQDLIPPLYKEILASGNVLLTTPNQFEFELLTDHKVTDIPSLISAISTFRSIFKVANLVISSLQLEDGSLISVGVTATKIFYIPIKSVDCHFNGSGDLFAALLANKFFSSTELNPEILSDTLSKIYNVLSYTFDEARKIDPTVSNIKDLNIIGLRSKLLENNEGDLLEKVVYLNDEGMIKKLNGKLSRENETTELRKGNKGESVESNFEGYTLV